MAGPIARAAARQALRQVRHVETVAPGRAEGLVARVYEQVVRDFGMLAPPVALHAPVPDALAACWLMLRESLIATGPASRAVKETTAAAVSAANACPYCVDVHTTVLAGLLRSADARHVATGRVDSLGDPRLRAVARWAATRRAAAAPPVPAPLVPEVVGVLVTFHYLNRMVSTFLEPSPIPTGLPAGLRTGMRRALGALMAPVAGRVREPGTSLSLLPPAGAVPDLEWATDRPTLAGAFARAFTAIDGAGLRLVPEPVRAVVDAQLGAWDGTPPGPGLEWLDEPLRALDPAHRPAGRLAVVIALSPFRVETRLVAAFRQGGESDASLVGLASWASLAAARRIGRRIGERLQETAREE